MTEELQRKADGTFAAGQSGNPKGRPPKARELALVAITHEIVNASNWRLVVDKRLLDALGKKRVTKLGADGKPQLNAQGQVLTEIIDDPDSTSQGRNAAATWLRDTAIGRPTEFISADPWQSPYEQVGAYTVEELNAIYALLEKLRSDSGSDVDSPSGVGSESRD